MNVPEAQQPRLAVRDLFIIIGVVSVLLAAATQYRNGIWLVLVPGSFYLPYVLLCTLITGKWRLVLSVLVLHTVVVAMWATAMKLAYGDVEQVPLLALLSIIDLPMLPVYLVVPLQIAIPISIIVGGAIYSAIAWGLRHLRYR